MKCSFCVLHTHTWGTPDDKRICFNCMRSQRDSLTDRVMALEIELKAVLGNEAPSDPAPRWVVS